MSRQQNPHQDSSEPGGLTLQPAQRIQVIVPDDGTDRRLLESLRSEYGVTRAHSTPVRAVAALQDAKSRRGRLPEPLLARLVTVIVAPDQADVIFDHIYAAARIGRPGGGLVLMHRLAGATVFDLPAELPPQ